MQDAADKVDSSVVRRFEAQVSDLFSRLLLLTLGQVDDNHVGASFNDSGIQCQASVQGFASSQEIGRRANSFEDPLHMTTA